MKKNTLSLISIFMAFTLLFSGCGGKGKDKKSAAKKPQKTQKTAQAKPKLSLGLVTDMTGVKGNNLNSLLNDSLQKLSEKKKGKYFILQPHNQKDYVNDLNDLTNVGAKLVFVVGNEATKPVEQAANKHPNNIFCLIDGVVNKPNVVSISLKHNEGGFLAGVVAAKATHSKVVGFIGDMGDSGQKEYEIGYKAGVMTVNPKIKTLSTYISKSDSAKDIIKLTSKMNKNKADIVFAASIKNSNNIIEASKVNNFWVIAASPELSKSTPKNILCSVDSDLSKVIKAITTQYSSNKLKGIQVYSLGIKEKVVDIKDKQKSIPPKIKKELEKYKKQLEKGKMNVPKTEKELEEFKKNLKSMLSSQGKKSQKGSKSKQENQSKGGKDQSQQDEKGKDKESSQE